MTIVIKNKTIEIKHRDINIVQTTDSNTQEPFKTDKELEKWLKEYLQRYLGLYEMSVSVKIKNENGSDVTEIFEDEKFTLDIISSNENLNGNHSIFINDTEYKVNFVNGISKIDITLPAGDYCVSCKDNEYIIGDDKFVEIEYISDVAGYVATNRNVFKVLKK